MWRFHVGHDVYNEIQSLELVSCSIQLATQFVILLLSILFQPELFVSSRHVYIAFSLLVVLKTV